VASEGYHSVLDDLIESRTARLQADEPVDAEEVVRRHPEYADRLRRRLPALRILADFGGSSLREIEGVDSALPGAGRGVRGDFRFVREIGRGGMGVVYEAQQISLDRRVALKVFPLAAAMDSEQLQRFQLEAHAAVCLHHTTFVPVQAVDCEGGVPFYAMQFIEGRSLGRQPQECWRSERRPSSCDHETPAHRRLGARKPRILVRPTGSAPSQWRNAPSSPPPPVAGPDFCTQTIMSYFILPAST
jgi:serine/threonine-protein kinase